MSAHKVKRQPPELLAKASDKSETLSTLSSGIAKTQRYVLGVDFHIERLDYRKIAKNKRDAKKPQYREYEKLFLKVMEILKANFAESEIESEKQYRRYFYDMLDPKMGCAPYFFNVAIDNRGEAIGVFIGSASPQSRLISFNIIGVEESLQLSNVASEAIRDMLNQPQKFLDTFMLPPKHPGIKMSDFDYVLAEVERPDFRLKAGDDGLTEKQIELRNKIRPAFHDNVSGVRAIRLPNGQALTYLLPIMASNAERKAAEAAGSPLEPEELLFCLRPLLPKLEEEGISSKEAATHLIWFFKDYLEKECSDVKPKEVNALLAKSLEPLANVSADELEKILRMKGDHRDIILERIPEQQLSFMKIADTAVQ